MNQEEKRGAFRSRNGQAVVSHLREQIARRLLDPLLDLVSSNARSAGGLRWLGGNWTGYRAGYWCANVYRFWYRRKRTA